ncbi:hypothetical protein [Aquibacillus sediminis]|uniref:hypothetical protein n=1 Tax=Aquibacillus sediminis TaxID=2574734 RepID=UPI001109B60F|nr:hypothetical protein [Aquibacillus sediminis]
MAYLLVSSLAVVYFITLKTFALFSMYTVGAGILSLLITLLYIRFWITHVETRIEKIENFLTTNKNKPHFHLIYAIANQMDSDVKATTADLLDKEKRSICRAYYQVTTALYFNNVTEARNHVEKLKPECYRLYFRGLILLKEGNIEEADTMIEQINKPWMKFALLAEREQKLNNLEWAINYANKAKRKMRGLNKYHFHKTYERQFGLDAEHDDNIYNQSQTASAETVPFVKERSSSLN